MSGPGGGRRLLPQTTRSALDSAWREREEEARLLTAGGFLSTAASLRMYALEILLKSLVCRKLDLPMLPAACKTHDLSEIVLFTGLKRELEDPGKAALRQNWDRLVEFGKQRLNDQRYLPRATFTRRDAEEIDRALDDPMAGVLTWLLNRP